MLFKPSPQTARLLKRGNWLFFPLWLATLGYVWLTAEGIIPGAWNQVFFPAFGALFVVNLVYAFLTLDSARHDATKSQHPNPDVAALIDGEIDLAEYGRRRSRTTAGETPSTQEPPTSAQEGIHAGTGTRGDA